MARKKIDIDKIKRSIAREAKRGAVETPNRITRPKRQRRVAEVSTLEKDRCAAQTSPRIRSLGPVEAYAAGCADRDTQVIEQLRQLERAAREGCNYERANGLMDAIASLNRGEHVK